jgi:hypothetical protein
MLNSRHGVLQCLERNFANFSKVKNADLLLPVFYREVIMMCIQIQDAEDK